MCDVRAVLGWTFRQYMATPQRQDADQLWSKEITPKHQTQETTLMLHLPPLTSPLHND
jgi:hypothetical protein